MSAECLYDVRGKSVLCPWNIHAVFVDQSRCIFYTVYAQQFVNLVNGYVLMQSRRYPTIHNSPIIVTKKTIASQVVNRSQRDEESQQFVIIVFVRKECKASRYFRSHKFISAIIIGPFLRYLWIVVRCLQMLHGILHFAARESADYLYVQ